MTVIRTPRHVWRVIACPDNSCTCHWECGITSRSVIRICATDNRNEGQQFQFRGTLSIYTRSLDSWSHKDMGLLDAYHLIQAMVMLEDMIKKPIRALSKKQEP